MSASVGTQCDGRTLGGTAIDTDGERHRFGGAEKAVQDRMSRLVIREEPAQLRRQLELAVPHGAEEILKLQRTRRRPRDLPGDPDPAFDVGSRMPARCERCTAQVGPFQIVAEMHAEDSGQCRNIRQRDDDVLVEPAGAHQSRVQF